MKKLLLVLALSGLAGCAPTALVSPIVTGVVMWKEGEAHKYYNEELDTTYRAVKNSLKDLGHPVVSDEKSPDGYKIVAGDKDKFKITVRLVKAHVTEVRVRVNFMGDKPYAELLYKQVDSNTGTVNFDESGKPVSKKKFRPFR